MSKFLSDHTSPLTLAGISDLTTGLPVIATSSSSIGTGLLSISDTTNLTTQLANKNQLDFTQQTGGVDAPSIGSVRVFAKSDKNLYVKNDAGEETRIGINYAGLSESGQVLFLNKSEPNDFGYNTLSTSLTSTGEVSTDYIITGASQLLDSFITDANFPNITELKQGLSRLTLFCSVDAVDGSTTISFDVYIRSSAGSEDWLFSSDNSIDITNTASPEDISLDLAIQNTTFDPTDRIVIKLYGGKTSIGNRTLTVKYEGNSNYSNWRSTLNGLESVSAKTQNQYATPAITDFVGTVSAKSDFTSYLDYDIDTVLSSTITVSPDGRSASFTSVNPQTPFVTYPVSNILSQRLEMVLDKTGSAVGGLKELRIFFGSLYNSSSNKFIYNYLSETVTIFDGATSSTLPTVDRDRIVITYDGVTMELRDPSSDTILLQHSTPTAGGSSLITIMCVGAGIGYSELDILEYGNIDSATLEPTRLSFKPIPGVVYNGLQMSNATTLSLQSQNLTLDASDVITATAPVVTNNTVYTNQLKVSDDISGYLTAQVSDETLLSTITIDPDKRSAEYFTTASDAPRVTYSIGGNLVTTVKMDLDTIGDNAAGERYLEIYFGSYLQATGNRLKMDFIAGTTGIFDGTIFTTIASPSTTRLVYRYDRVSKTTTILDPVDETTELLAITNPLAPEAEELDVIFRGGRIGYSNIEISDIGDVNSMIVSSTGLSGKDLVIDSSTDITVNAPIVTNQTTFSGNDLVSKTYADTKSSLGRVMFAIRGDLKYNNGEPLPPLVSGTQPIPGIVDDTPILQYEGNSVAKSGLVTDDYNDSRVIIDYLGYVFTGTMMRYTMDNGTNLCLTRILQNSVTVTSDGVLQYTMGSSVSLEGSHIVEIRSFTANAIRYVSLIVDGRVEDTVTNTVPELSYMGQLILNGTNLFARQILAIDTSDLVTNEPDSTTDNISILRSATNYVDNKYDQSLNTTDAVAFDRVTVGAYTTFASNELVPKYYADTKTALGRVMFGIRGDLKYNNSEPLPPLISGTQPTPGITDDTPTLEYGASSVAKSGLTTDDYNSSRVVFDYLNYIFDPSFTMRYVLDSGGGDTVIVRINETTVTFTVAAVIVLTLTSTVSMVGSHIVEIQSFYANSVRYVSLIVDGRVEDTQANPIAEATYQGTISISGNNLIAREILALDTSNEVVNEPVLTNSLANVLRTAKRYVDTAHDQELNTTSTVLFSQVDIGDLSIADSGTNLATLSCQGIDIVANDLDLQVSNEITMTKTQTLANVTNGLELVSKNYITANNTNRNPLYYNGYINAENTTATSTQTVIDTYKNVPVPDTTFTVYLNNSMFNTTTTSDNLQITYINSAAPKYVHVTFQCLIEQSQSDYTSRYGIAVNNVIVPSTLTYLKCTQIPTSRNFVVQGIVLMLNTNDYINLQWAVDDVSINRTTILKRCNVTIRTL